MLKISQYKLKVEKFYVLYRKGDRVGTLTRFNAKDWVLSIEATATKDRKAVVKTFESMAAARAFAQKSVAR